MTPDSSCSSSDRIVFVGLVSLVYWCALQLFFVGYWHRDNNYLVLPGSYRLRTIDSAEFSQLTPEQQVGWDQIPNSDKYVLITIKNSFIFRHVGSQLIIILFSAFFALCWYSWYHELPNPCSRTRRRATLPTTVALPKAPLSTL